MNQEKNIRVAFVHGRPKGHPIHASYARLLNADFFHEDKILRWHDKPYATKLRRYLSWILNGFFFTQRKNYDIFLTECIRMPQLVMKITGLMGKNQKLVALMADESLYFLSIGKYNPITTYLMMLFFKKADAIICIGKLQTQLAKKLLQDGHHKKIYSIYNGVSSYRSEKFKNMNPDIASSNLICIANVSSEWRTWYKGIDIMVESFALAFEKNNDLRFYIVGDIDISLISNLLKPYNDNVKAAIIFTGHTADIQIYLAQCALYLHCSRGDAFPTTVLESMSAGLVPIISIDTGTFEIVSQVDNNLVTELKSESISERINWFINLPYHIKKRLSMKCKEVIAPYKEENALKNFAETFEIIVDNFRKIST